jgi:beta-lactamase regulating signal transducer with metallopeptidase domain
MSTGLLGAALQPGVAAVADLAVRGTLLLAGAGLASLALRRAPAAARHLAWAAAFAGMLALPLLAVALPAWRVPILPGEPAASPSAAPRPAAPVMRTEEVRRMAGAAASPSAEPSPAPARNRGMPMAVIALLGWMAGALLSAARLAVSVARVRREERVAAPLVDGPAARLRDRLVWRMGIDRPVALLEGAPDSMPLTWGVRRPHVMLPAGTAAWPADRLEAVLTHELAHVRRRDCAWQMMAEAACALHWFNPLAWAAARRLRLESEHACDDQVLLAGSRGADYAAHLLDVARTLRPPRPALLAGVPMARPSQLRTRMLAVLSADRPRGGVPARVAAPALLGSAALVALIAALTPARAGAAETALAGVRCENVGHGSHETDLDFGRVWTTSWGNGAGCGGDGRIEGDVRFTAGFTDVASIAPGGLLRLELRDGGRRSQVEVRPGANGLTRVFRSGGRRQPWGPEVERWLAAALPELMRHTTYAASERAASVVVPAPAPAAPPAVAVAEARNPTPLVDPDETTPADEDEDAAAAADTIPVDDLDRADATTSLVHQDDGDGTESERILLAKDARLTVDRARIESISLDGGYVILRENLPGGGARRVHIRAGNGGALRYTWNGDFGGTDREAWLRGMVAHFARITRPQRQW